MFSLFRWEFRVLKPVFVCCAILPGTVGTSHADDSSVITEIENQWKLRERAIRSLRVELAVERHYEAGSHIGKDAMSEQLFPPGPVNASSRGIFILDDQKWRVEWTGEDWVNRLEAVAPQHLVYAYDGDKFRIFKGVPNTDPAEAHSIGTIDLVEQRATPMQIPVLAPMFLYARPFAPLSHLDETLWARVPPTRHAVVDGVECVVLEFAYRENHSIRKKLTVARRPGYPVVSVEIDKIINISIKYDDQKRNELSPKSWTVTLLFGDMTRIAKTERASVLAFEVNPVGSNNKNVSFEFPPGTEVMDYTQAPRGFESYIVLSGGDRRPITDLERRQEIPYTELLSTMPLGEHRNSWTKLSALAVCFIFGAAIVIFTWLRLVRK